MKQVETLKKLANWKKRSGPVVFVVMDGVAYGKRKEGDAVANAVMETFAELSSTCPLVKLKAHGEAVGLPSDEDMGNSEVGHNAFGAGRIFAQGAKLVNKSLQEGSMFSGNTWQEAIKTQGVLHFIGLLSDGGVHSNIKHLEAMVKQAKIDGVKVVRIHALLDGRDVPATSALEYFEPFEALLAELNADGTFDAKIASGGGRMYITMDRYNADWPMVERGWHTHVLGEGRQFSSSVEAIKTLRAETSALDQDLPPFVIAKDGKAIGTVQDGDSVILFNYRGDRALEITSAFESGNDFPHFDRIRVPKVFYAGMMEYDGDLHVPKHYLVTPPAIDRTLAEFLCALKLKQYSISETQKFGHITYFFNGNKSGKFDENLETYVEIKGDNVPFEQRPAMKCAEITDAVLEAINSKEYDFIKINYPNGDMVGHTGSYQAAVASLEAMDLNIGRLKKAIEAVGGILVVSADHGNADEMYEFKKDGTVAMENGKPKAKTSHSLNPVPFIIFDPTYQGEYDLKLKEGLGISHVAATLINLLGYEAPSDYDTSIITLK
ncbi:2,3-bisphosphoglycerate-independent phosphoglycerate mutase [Entomospira culicis]|uniref:2,3-bisphosphoglycerate-independent phosphoglycerate mutase n=1 Tax=Entomospira culicis TaxID=2719989 RepID=A0A968GJM8_9SPIO|nr:2,3-bisphosphoglycerate-independent phosphoglycerate mutase [Entomospira culicis]NIZ18855.1 2,3-bisphosphoglycerate-independent phosphoglycerate mutase [Entomospira culicis]NIZ69070.1 2,3-bisphosphoglycerate-independent phosphoglycerate mutase [Entomospira culicis]WDI37657.1 2,3-bisphosphoglycerate-independent phosphoglycerate mutase [Entomospira culicis]WDI39285.1 2,3-bisphosphoglycerate-independent phosphoglycerate mutase [Entomospira culicis]